MKHDIEDTASSTVRVRAKEQSEFGESDAEKQEMQKRMEAAGTPGPAHKALDALAGNWRVEVKRFGEPGGTPNVSQGTAKTSWTLNGHFLEEEFHGEMMGKTFTGLGLMGYDNTRQTFKSVWMSDMQTSMFTSEGKGENGNKVITLEGKSDCPGTGQKDMPMKQVFRVIGPDKHIMEMFAENVKTMEIIYTRK